MAGGALSIRRFLMQQYLAIAAQSPARGVLLALHRSLGKGGLLSPQEVAYIQQTELAEGAPRVIFSVRAPRSLFGGVTGCLWNVAIGTALAPVVGLSMVPHQLAQHGLKGVVPGMILTPIWAGAFAGLGYLAALQQLCWGVYHQLVMPVHFTVTLRPWNALTCRYCAIEATPQAALAQEPPNSVLREYAMKRANKKKMEDADDVKDMQKKREKAANDPYMILGVSRDATEKEIREAFNKKVLTVHPDRNPSPTAHEDFDKLTKAYRILSNPTKRKKFDIAGNDGVDDLGQKKRDGVRGLFGGDQLAQLSGDVRFGNFSLRVIDGLDFQAHELAVVKCRMQEAARVTLLSYLEGYPKVQQQQQSTAEELSSSSPPKSTANNTSTSSSSSSSGTATPKRPPFTTTSSGSHKAAPADPVAQWNQGLRLRVHKFVNTGLAKEVLWVLGQTYADTVERVTKSSPPQRAVLAVTKRFPRRATMRLHQLIVLSKVRPNTFKDTTKMVDLAWRLSVSELMETAELAALGVLLDPTADAEEKARRAAALTEMATLFQHVGLEFKGCNKQTADALMDSLRSYQQAKQRQEQQQDK